MRFLACLKKDILLLTGGGIRAALFLGLPVLLVFIMLFGMKDLSDADVSVRPFDIAVRDLDNTYMSRTLITQLERVELFNTVYRARERTDKELADVGCAAIVTIPKDFFYDLYEMKDTDVVLTLNGNMPREAALVKETFVSLLDILSENQRVYYAAARIKYGELTEDEWQEVYYEYSASALESALSRNDLYGVEKLYSGEIDGQKLFFAAGVISMLIMFFPLSLLRSVTYELDAGVAARFSLAGGSFFEALASKFVVSLAMAAAPTAIIMALFAPYPQLLPLFLLLFTAGFSFFLFVSLVFRDPSAAQLVGILIMLAVLTLGGAFYPTALMPKLLQSISRFLLPDVILTSMRYASLGRGLSAGYYVLPAAFACVFLLLSIPLERAVKRA